jgi:ArsR family transcriptional regulator
MNVKIIRFIQLQKAESIGNRGALELLRKYECAPMNTDQLTKIAQALSDPTRLRIFEAIAAKKEVNCSEIVSQYDLAPGTVSHHLKTLSEAGLIESRRDGQFIYNRVIPETLKQYAEKLGRMATARKARKRR